MRSRGRAVARVPVRRSAAVLAALSLLVPACRYPRDAQGTLDEVRGATLRVGVIDDSPWASTRAGRHRGVEVTLVEQLAGRLDARVEWVDGPAHELLTALEEHVVQLVVGGLVSDDPWGGRVTFTPPYATTEVVVAVPRGRTAPESLAGREVAVERGSPAEAAVEGRGGQPLPVDDLRDAREGLVAAEEWQLDTLGYEPSAIRLVTHHHVMAVPKGENAWLVEVEDFLDASRPRAQRLIAEAAEG